jgi:hypothetical protein
VDGEVFNLQGADAFEIYVDDVRYSVPTLYLIAETDEAAARRAAHARFTESEHHAGVELWQGGRRILALGAAARDDD